MKTPANQDTLFTLIYYKSNRITHFKQYCCTIAFIFSHSLSSLYSTMTKSTLNPKTAEYSFFGPLGTGAITILTPAITYSLYFACPNSYDDETCQLLQKPAFERLLECDFWKSLFSLEAFAVYLAWYAFTVVAWAIIPAQWVRGTQLRDGTFKYYKMNGGTPSVISISS